MLSKTPLFGTHIPLPKWFAVLALLVNAKKSMSSHQLARDDDLTQPTALLMQERLMVVMASDQATLLGGIVEADETLIGGKPRKQNKRDDQLSKGKTIQKFIRSNVSPSAQILVTDEITAYHGVRSMFPHSVINYRRANVNGPVYTNTIEGFWNPLKRASYGRHHNSRSAECRYLSRKPRGNTTTAMIATRGIRSWKRCLLRRLSPAPIFNDRGKESIT